jgi:phosphomannomutase
MHKFFILPYTGTFLQFRGSLLNWCPIGRSASAEERDAWVDFDKKNIVRVKYVEMLQDYLRHSGMNVTVALGGSTSIDIYPAGWDKTYSLRYYEGKEIFFVGDKCQPGGNDYHIYRELAKVGRAFETSGTDETCEIIARLAEK